MPRMKLSVSSSNIAESMRRGAYHCMIASAIKEKIPTARWVLVDLQSIRWSDREAGRRFIFRTPLPAQRAMLDFDKGLIVKPFQFTLPAPETRPIYKRYPRPKSKVPAKKVYKKAKLLPERATERMHGLRLLGE